MQDTRDPPLFADPQERPSGVPPPGGLGASRNEVLAIAAAVLVFALIALAFWFEASR